MGNITPHAPTIVIAPPRAEIMRVATTPSVGVIVTPGAHVSAKTSCAPEAWLRDTPSKSIWSAKPLTLRNEYEGMNESAKLNLVFP